jgi:hypothetical protein
VSPSELPAYLAPALCMFCLSVVYSASSVAPVRFLGQVHVGCKSGTFRQIEC